MAQKKSTRPVHIANHIDVRVQTEIGQAWELIHPTTIRITQDQEPEDLAGAFVTPDAVQVRWNWGDLPPGGMGCGHYITGPAHPHYYLTQVQEGSR